MFKLLVIPLLLLLSSCNGSGGGGRTGVSAANTNSGNSIISGEAPLRWGNPNASQVTPLVVSQAFNSSERNAINQMSDEWEAAAANLFNFFAGPLPVVPGADALLGHTKLSDYSDNEMGIYKSINWFQELNSQTLAITRFLGVRTNVGSPNEFIQIIHADIIVNERDFNFSTDSSPGTIDLATVILHELGHFLGLPHTNQAEDSVMVPTIGAGTLSQKAKDFDRESIRELYQPFNNGPAAFAALSVDPNEGQLVEGVLELRQDGSCFHFIEGEPSTTH